MVLFCQFVLKILSKNQILTSIKGRYSVANLRKTKIYNTNLDLVTDNVYTNFGLILSIRSQDRLILSLIMCIQTLVSFCQFVLKILSKNQILTPIKGRNSLANLRKTAIYNTKVDLVNDNVYTKLIGQFVFKILSKNSILTSIKGRNSVANLPKYDALQSQRRSCQ